ncbi:fluoride efflux transporter FluC [Paenibacillus montaniterrae]|uniref:fluoride efflux transporter FluC n=1 Tax=Paenibacillus montaniterrae TaxID=429341 RepID=UPI001BCE971B|nr:CrcB family protein [Paenibacillus montaniterrae]
MKGLQSYVWVALGGAAGTVLRAIISQAYPLQHNFHIVWINILGSLLLAVIFTSFSTDSEAHMRMKWLLGTGMMGGFTTMSTFSLDVVKLLEAGHYAIAGLYVLGSVVGGGVAAVIGILLTTLLKR